LTVLQLAPRSLRHKVAGFRLGTRFLDLAHGEISRTLPQILD